MNKEKLVYAFIGLLAGLVFGYIGTDTLNDNYAAADKAKASQTTASAPQGELPPDHPPTGATGATGAGNSPASGGGGAQPEVTAVIEQARKEPNNFAAQMQAGALFAQIQRLDDALEFYARAQKLKPNDVAALTALGNTHFDLSHFTDAERWYKEALKLKPDDVNVRTDLGLSYFKREPKEIDKAIAEFRAVLQQQANHEQSLQNLTAALLAKGDKAEARVTLDKLAQVNPNNPALAQFRTQLN